MIHQKQGILKRAPKTAVDKEGEYRLKGKNSWARLLTWKSLVVIRKDGIRQYGGSSAKKSAQTPMDAHLVALPNSGTEDDHEADQGPLPLVCRERRSRGFDESRTCEKSSPEAGLDGKLGVGFLEKAAEPPDVAVDSRACRQGCWCLTGILLVSVCRRQFD